ESITVREFKAGGKTMVTTMLCPKSASKSELKALYKQRWSVELGIDDCQDSCPIFYATFSLTSCSSVSDFSGFNQTSLTGSQFRVSRLQRSGFRCFADS
ncbi:hypothetical protein, partial [Thiolapillus sp.]|uniref:hypothetical protein n=1 Tax=Thiolapillus sp. TaxID=2017437 RepID=UPI003AF73222